MAREGPLRGAHSREDGLSFLWTWLCPARPQFSREDDGGRPPSLAGTLGTKGPLKLARRSVCRGPAPGPSPSCWGPRWGSRTVRATATAGRRSTARPELPGRCLGTASSRKGNGLETLWVRTMASRPGGQSVRDTGHEGRGFYRCRALEGCAGHWLSLCSPVQGSQMPSVFPSPPDTAPHSACSHCVSSIPVF